MQDQFESLLNKHDTKENSAVLTHEKLLKLNAEVKKILQKFRKNTM